MWVVRVYDTSDELIAEHQLEGVTQAGLERALGFMPSAYASTPLNMAALQNINAAFPGQLGEEKWGDREFFLDDDAEPLPEFLERRSSAAAARRW
jgi:hypothetical protein